MKYQNEFKCIDTQEKAYFLGQAFGDGCNTITKKYRFTMASINTDTELYKKLQELFPFLKLKTYASHSNMIYLESNDRNFCLDLAALGLVSPKTKNDETKEFHFPNLNKEFLPHFIRGYFDADGSAWYPKRYRSRNNLHIEFGCSTPNFLEDINKILIENGIKFTNKSREKKAGNGKYYKSYILYSASYKLSKKFANFIYSNASIYLSYKYDSCYRKKIDMPPTMHELYGNCIYCGSENLHRQQIRMMKHGPMQRIKCVDCNRSFSVPLPK